MWTPSSHTSPSRTLAYESTSEARPARSDFTSGPDSTMRASNVSSISKSCRALRFVATVRSPGGVAAGNSDLEVPAHREQAGDGSDHDARAEQPRQRVHHLLRPDPGQERDLGPQRIDEGDLHDEQPKDGRPRADQALHDALDQEGQTDEPVRRPHQPHDADLLAPGEHSHANRVAD